MCKRNESPKSWIPGKKYRVCQLPSLGASSPAITWYTPGSSKDGLFVMNGLAKIVIVWIGGPW